MEPVMTESWVAFPSKGIVKACEEYLSDNDPHDDPNASSDVRRVRKLLQLAQAAEGAHRDVNVTASDFNLIAAYRG